MPRTRGGVVTRRRHKRVLKQAKGYFSARRRHFRTAKETLYRALKFAYRDRRTRKREFRSLWIQRINAACRLHGLSYSRFMDGLKKARVELDRKSLASLALHEPEVFTEIAALVKQATA